MDDATPIRAALYARVSTDEQAKDGTSLDAQRVKGKAYIDLRDWTFAGEYVDEGVSGSKDSRPALDALMKVAKAGEIDAIVVTKLDRFSRSMSHLAPALNDLDAWGVRFVSLAENFDSDSPSGRLQRNILGSFAEFEREQIRERMMGGQRSVAALGFWPGGPAPHGYRIVADGPHKRLEIDPQESEALLLAVQTIVDEGGTVGTAVDRINALGHRRRRAGKWDRNSYRRRLVLSHYTGTWVWRPGTPDEIPISIPAILTPDRLAALHDALAHMPNVGKRPRKNVYPLSLRIFGACGEPYTGVARADRGGTRFYRCRNRNHHAVEKGTKCSCSWVSADDVETVAWDAVKDLLAEPERLVAMAKDYLGLRADQVTVEREQVADVDRKIAKVERTLTDTVGEYLAAGIDAKAVKKATETLEAELAALRQHRKMLDDWKADNLAESERMRRLWELADYLHDRFDTLSPEDQANVYRLLEVKIVVDDTACPGCVGKGRLPTRFGEGRKSCGRCRSTGSVPLLRLTGTVPDMLLDAAGGGDGEVHSLDLTRKGFGVTTTSGFPFMIEAVVA